MQLTIEGLRGGLVETLHPCSAVAVSGGKVVFQAGPDIATFWRSASKPFQLLNSLAHLDPDLVDELDDVDIALGAASHSGQPSHVLRVRALLQQLGLSEHQLQCGAAAPMHEGAARAAGTFMPAMNNCSGKHTFMLAASVAQGWSPDYRSPGHPLQVANRATLDEYAGVSHGVGVDGCSIPTFHAPLSAQAFAWEKIAEAMDQHGFFAGADPGRRLGRIGWAMHHHAFFVSGNKRLDLAVVNAASEPLTVKIGAEGLFCIARPNARQGIAIKVHTGVTEALGPAVRAVFAALGVELSGVLPGERVFNVRRALVGERRATFSGGPVASS